MERWLPCCWWVVGEGPAVAKVAEALRVEVVVGCWGEVEAGASYPWVAAINLMTRWRKETLWTFWNTEYPSMTALHTSIFLNTDASLEFYRKLSQYKWKKISSYILLSFHGKVMFIMQNYRLYSPMGCPGGAGTWLIGGGGGCIQGGGIPLGFGGIWGPPMFGIGGGKLWGPPWPWCMPW